MAYYKRRRRSIVTRARKRSYNTSSLPPERKFLDVYHTESAPSVNTGMTGGEKAPTTGVVGCISAPSVGDQATNRDGKHCILQSIELKGWVTRVEGEVGKQPGMGITIAIVLDKQTNGTQLNSEDVFQNISGNKYNNTIPHRNLLFGKRFRVLKQLHFNLDPADLTWDGAAMHQHGKIRTFDWYSKISLPVNFNGGTTADVANVVDNSLHVLAFATEAGYLFGYSCRIRFIG